jgi:hypothetical protein
MLLVTVGLLMLDSAHSQSSRAGTGEVIAIREIKLKAGVDSVKFERFVIDKYNPAMEGAVPGVKLFITKGYRGQKKGSYAHFFIFDSQKTLHAIVPEEGKMADWFVPFWEKDEPIRKELDEYLEADWMAVYTDYVVLR